MRKIMNWNPNMKTTAFFLSMLLTMLLPAVVSGQQKPTTGYAPVNGLKMYYEVHGSGEPVVLLHGAFMTITNNSDRVDRRTFQDAESDRRRNAGPRAHGRHQTRYQLRKPRRRCGGAARSPQDPKRGSHRLQHGRRRGDAVCDPPSGQSAQGRQHFGRVPPATAGSRKRLDAFPKLTAEAFKGSPIEAEYKKLSPTPDEFPNFVKRVIAIGSEAARLRRRQAQGHQGADVFHPRRRRRRAARAHRGNVPPEGRRGPRRHAAALRIEIGHLARHDTRHADAPHAQRSSRW